MLRKKFDVMVIKDVVVCDMVKFKFIRRKLCKVSRWINKLLVLIRLNIRKWMEMILLKYFVRSRLK